jgi:hypothetical protein
LAVVAVAVDQTMVALAALVVVMDTKELPPLRIVLLVKVITVAVAIGARQSMVEEEVALLLLV